MVLGHGDTKTQAKKRSRKHRRRRGGTAHKKKVYIQVVFPPSVVDVCILNECLLYSHWVFLLCIHCGCVSGVSGSFDRTSRRPRIWFHYMHRANERRAAKHSDKIVKDIIVLLTRVTGARCVRQELLSSCFRQIGHKMCGEAKSGNLRRM